MKFKSSLFLMLCLVFSQHVFAEDSQQVEACYFSASEIDQLKSDPENLSKRIKMCFKKENLFWWMSDEESPSYTDLFNLCRELEESGYLPTGTTTVKKIRPFVRDADERTIYSIQIGRVSLRSENSSKKMSIHFRFNGYRSIDK